MGLCFLERAQWPLEASQPADMVLSSTIINSGGGNGGGWEGGKATGDRDEDQAS
jgi:hypothetical protein